MSVNIHTTTLNTCIYTHYTNYTNYTNYTGLKVAAAVCTVKADCMLVVIAPCTLIENWKREGEGIGFHVLGSGSGSGTSKGNSKTKAKSKVTSVFMDTESNADKYSSSNSGNVGGLTMKITSWSKIPTPSELLCHCKSYIVVADEAHAMQTMTSIRTKNALLLMRHHSCIGCILATGTPLKNGRPVNLYPLLYAIRHPIANNKIEYEKKYCDAKKTMFNPWDVNGTSNLNELKCRVGSSILRKTKQECLKDLPIITRIRVEVDTSRVYRQKYQDIINTHKAEVAKSNAKKGRGNGNNGNSGRYDKELLHKAGELLGRLRQCCSLAKVDGTCNTICEHYHIEWNTASSSSSSSSSSGTGSSSSSSSSDTGSSSSSSSSDTGTHTNGCNSDNNNTYTSMNPNINPGKTTLQPTPTLQPAEQRLLCYSSTTGKCHDRSNPIVLFVWYKETATQIQNQLNGLEYVIGSNSSSSNSSSMGSSSGCAPSQGSLVCTTLTGDIIQQKVCVVGVIVLCVLGGHIYECCYLYLYIYHSNTKQL